MTLTEIAISFSGSAGSKDPALIHIWDIRTGSLLSSYKNNRSLGASVLYSNLSASYLTSSSQLIKEPVDESVTHVKKSGKKRPLPSSNANGVPSQTSGGVASLGTYTPTLLFSPQCDRAMIHVYALGRSSPFLTFQSPEKLATLAVSHSGEYCVGGGVSGRIYLWHIQTGHLLKMFDAHYKTVSVLRWTTDDVCFVSASQDAMIHVWSLAQVLSHRDDQHGQGVTSPKATISSHTLPITDIVLGGTLSSHAYGYSVSMDRTCRIWKVSTGELLYSVVFPRALTSIAVNCLETLIFCGSVSGDIFRYSLVQEIKSTPGGQDDGSLNRLSKGVVAEGLSSPKNVLSSHSSKVTSLALSMDETLLVSSSDDGTCKVWDTLSNQLLRSVSHHLHEGGGSATTTASVGPSVSGLMLTVKPPFLMDAALVPDHKNAVASFGRYPIPSQSVTNTSSETSSTLQSKPSTLFVSTRGEKNLSTDSNQSPASTAGFIQSFVNTHASSSASLFQPMNKKSTLDPVVETMDSLRMKLALLQKQNHELFQMNSSLYDMVLIKK